MGSIPPKESVGSHSMSGREKESEDEMNGIIDWQFCSAKHANNQVSSIPEVGNLKDVVIFLLVKYT